MISAFKYIDYYITVFLYYKRSVFMETDPCMGGICFLDIYVEGSIIFITSLLFEKTLVLCMNSFMRSLVTNAIGN